MLVTSFRAAAGVLSPMDGLASATSLAAAAVGAAPSVAAAATLAEVAAAVGVAGLVVGFLDSTVPSSPFLAWLGAWVEGRLSRTVGTDAVW